MTMFSNARIPLTFLDARGAVSVTERLVISSGNLALSRGQDLVAERMSGLSAFGCRDSRETLGRGGRIIMVQNLLVELGLEEMPAYVVTPVT